MDNISIKLTKSPKKKPSEWTSTGFCRFFSDHQFLMSYSKSLGWHDAKIVPFDEGVNLGSSTKVFHYGQGIFEGLKAYRYSNDDIGIFRLTSHLHRMNQSAERLAMPNIDEDLVKIAINTLIDIDRSWTPDKDGCALYIRPFMFATDQVLGVSPSDNYMFSVILSPVSHYYGKNTSSTNILVEEKQARVPMGGTGSVKAIGNYASSLLASKTANNAGFEQVLWLDPMKHKNIEEVGTMNIFFVVDNKLITPKLTDTIMPGITRDSLLKIADDLGIEVEKRTISIDEIFTAHKESRLNECFGSGTAVSIAPVREIGWRDKRIKIPHSEPESISERLLSEITLIQYGHSIDRYGWTEIVNRSENIELVDVAS